MPGDEPSAGELFGEIGFGDLDRFWQEVDESGQVIQTTMAETIGNPSSREVVSMSIANHAILLKRVISGIFTDTPGISAQEKASIVATLLKEDDSSRVKFLKNLTGKTDEDKGVESFMYAYPDHDEMTEELVRHLDLVEEEMISHEDLADGLIHQHLEFMQTDLETLFHSDYFKAEASRNQRANEARKQAIQSALRIAETALGGVIAMSIWHQIRKRS